MPSISEMIAAKAAAAAAGAKTPRPAPAPKVDPDLQAAIDRIDPPGKSDRREAAKTAARSMILTDSPLPPKAEPAPPAQTPEVRSLGSHRGEMIDLCPAGVNQAVSDWHQAALQPETSLCLVRDKSDPERAWIGVRMDHANRTPILLMALPLYDATSEPF